jgi:hypothetical protein
MLLFELHSDEQHWATQWKGEAPAEWLAQTPGANLSNAIVLTPASCAALSACVGFCFLSPEKRSIW